MTIPKSVTIKPDDALWPKTLTEKLGGSAPTALQEAIGPGAPRRLQDYPLLLSSYARRYHPSYS